MTAHFRRAVVVAALAISAVGATSSTAPEPQGVAVIRGRLQRIVGPNGQWIPIGGLVVTLRDFRNIRSTPAFSGYDGMYYFYAVPPGEYTAEVWYQNAQAPFLMVPIRVAYLQTPNGPLFDIAPIIVP